MALDMFDSKKTNWEGLWYQPDMHIYTSRCFTLADLRKFKGNIKILVRKNKFFEKDSRRPNYQFCICDSRAEKVQSFQVMKAISEAFENEAYIRLDDAVEVARRLLQDMQYGYSYDDLSVEAVSFMQEHCITPQDMLDEWLEKEGQSCD